MLKPSRSILASCLGLLALSTVSPAETVTTLDGEGEDTFVASNATTTPQDGSVDGLRLRSDATIRKTYLRFDLASIALAGGSITDASLTLTAMETHIASEFLAGLSLQLWGINDAAQGDALAHWNEETLTWNLALTNAQNTASATSFGVGATLLGSLDIATSGYTAGSAFVFTPTNSAGLVSFLQADTNDLVTFGLSYSAAGEGTSTNLSGRENAFAPPTLSIVPEPGSALLGGLGLSLLLARRRRA